MWNRPLDSHGGCADTVYPAGFVNATSMLEHDFSVAPGRTYMYYNDPTLGAPVIPFGFGLSLSTWEVAGCPGPLTIATDGSKDVNVTLTVTNTGRFTGDVVITAYLCPLNMPTQPRKKLWAFQRIADVAPKARETVRFAVTAEALALYDTDTGDIASLPGQYGLEFTDGSGKDSGKCGDEPIALGIIGDTHVFEKFPHV